MQGQDARPLYLTLEGVRCNEQADPQAIAPGREQTQQDAVDRMADERAEPGTTLQVGPVNGLVQQQRQESQWPQKPPEESIGQSEANARPGATHIPLKQQAKAGTD